MNEQDRQAEQIRKALSEELEQVQQIARQSMMYASDLGAAVRFLEESDECREHPQLINALTVALSCLGVAGIIRITDALGRCIIQQPADAGEHQALMADSPAGERICSTGPCTLFHYPYCQILITNMPLDDEYRHGILKDTLATIANGASNRAHALQRDIDLRSKQELLLNMLEATVQHIGQLGTSLNTQTDQAVTTMIGSIRDLIAEMNVLQDHEQSILALVHSYTDQQRRLTRDHLELDHHFQAIATLVSNISESRETRQATGEPGESSPASGIELF